MTKKQKVKLSLAHTQHKRAYPPKKEKESVRFANS